jgi:hypothetical protein
MQAGGGPGRDCSGEFELTDYQWLSSTQTVYSAATAFGVAQTQRNFIGHGFSWRPMASGDWS